MTVRVESIHIIAFGQFENMSIDFKAGFNLIYGNNESGKSTIASFIEGLLYGFDDGVKVKKFNDKQKKYQPTGSYKYAGFGIFNKDGKSYRISRNFYDGDYEIYDLDNKSVIDSQKSNLNYPGEFLLDLDYDLYKALISKYQAQDTSSKAKAKIYEMLSSHGDINFSANESINLLEEKTKEIGSDRAYAKPYMRTKEEIARLEEMLSDLNRLRKTYYDDFKLMEINRSEIRNKTADLKELREKRDLYRSNAAYKNLEDEIKYKNELNRVNKELENLENPKEISQIDDNKDWFNLNLYVLLTAILSFICIASKNYIWIPLAIILPLIILRIINFSKNEFRETTDKKYSNIDGNSEKYLELSYQKEKIEEVLRVLKNREQTSDLKNMEIIASIDINRVEDKIRSLEEELEILRNSNLDLERKLASAEDKLKDELLLIEDLDHKKARLADMEADKEAIALAISTIKDIIGEDSSKNNDFERKVSELIRSISKDKYKAITYDDKLNPLIEDANGQFIEIDKLSTGFYDQLNFAMSFATSNNLSEVFVIFDDAFINYDTDRLRRALYFLFDLSVARQVMYMTCHKREFEILIAEGMDFNLINLEEI